MKHGRKLGVVLLLLCTASAYAQLYKWVGVDGKVNYSDAPPPASARGIEIKSLTIGEANAADFPYELSEAMKNNPVTIYTTKNCTPCDTGRKLLIERGVPFAEKTVSTNEDIMQFRKIGGDGPVPLLIVGRAKESGFDPATWNSTLSGAGYPESSKLPKTYKNPPAQAAVPAPQPVAAGQDGTTSREKAAAKPAATELPSAIGNAPPGFRF